MMRYPGISRRRFIRIAGAAGLAACSGIPLRDAWSAMGVEGKSLKIAFYTDVHARVEWDTPLGMARAAEAIRSQKADLVLAGGDLITDGFQSTAAKVEPRWDAYMEMHRAIGSDIQAAIGNHDLVGAAPEDGSAPSEDPRQIFRARLGVDRTYRSFDALGYHFILLDAIEVLTGEDLPYRGYVPEGQMDWLRADLAKVKKDAPIIVLTHIPLLAAFVEATRGGTATPAAHRIINNNVEVMAMFEGRNLPLVLQGHNHVDEMIRWRNTRFITGGAVCGKWWRGPWYGTEEGFGMITLLPDRIEWEYIDYGWEARRP
ncbi:MAG: metallophosphoesterase [Verrucomicrobia bacterium]|nr:metallophosphoesterase [Verrucomicrobiota bacterium]